MKLGAAQGAAVAKKEGGSEKWFGCQVKSFFGRKRGAEYSTVVCRSSLQLEYIKVDYYAN